MKINWGKKNPALKLVFDDLDVGQSFRLVSGDAIYCKVEAGRSMDFFDSNGEALEYGMMEWASGKVWPPSQTPVELVEVVVNIEILKPELYDDRTNKTA